MVSWLARMNNAQIVCVRTFICALTRREKRERENAFWFLIGCLLLIGEFVDLVGYLFFPIVAAAAFFVLLLFMQINFSLSRVSYPIKTKSSSSELRDLSSLLTWKRKTKERHRCTKSHCWMMQVEEYCQIRSSLLHAHLNTNHPIWLLLATVCTTTTTAA